VARDKFMPACCETILSERESQPCQREKAEAGKRVRKQVCFIAEQQYQWRRMSFHAKNRIE
jgi:hypothetical protein